MTQITPVYLEDGTVIYIEAAPNVDYSLSSNRAESDAQKTFEPRQETTRADLGRQEKGIPDWAKSIASRSTAVLDNGLATSSVEPGHSSFKTIEHTIKAYTSYTLNAFREMAVAEVKKVNLEFGVNISGVGGIPYIASGTAGCNIKITVECAFPEPQKPAEKSAGEGIS